jgi:hypothetical protein
VIDRVLLAQHRVWEFTGKYPRRCAKAIVNIEWYHYSYIRSEVDPDCEIAGVGLARYGLNIETKAGMRSEGMS